MIARNHVTHARRRTESTLFESHYAWPSERSWTKTLLYWYTGKLARRRFTPFGVGFGVQIVPRILYTIQADRDIVACRLR